MKRFPVLLIVPTMIGLMIAGAVVYFRNIDGTFSTSGLSIGLCQFNDEIDPAKRERINDAAADYLNLFEREPVQARQQMSRVGRSATVERATMESAAAAFNAMPVGERAVTETYLVRFLSGSRAGLSVPCGFHNGRAAFVSRASTPFGAMVMFTEPLPGGSERTTSVWLEHEEGEWRVRAFHAGVSAILGMDAEDLWEAARDQRARGNMFNAAMLYAASRSVQYRGTFYQVRMWQDFNADVSTFAWPPPLDGTPPHIYRFGGEPFSVTSLQYNGMMSGELVLLIDHTPPAWTANEEAEAINRRFIVGFDAAYPEWRELFDAIAVRAAKPGTDQLWGTVFSRANGFSAPVLESASPASASETR